MDTMKLAELRLTAKEKHITGYTKMNKKMLLEALTEKPVVESSPPKVVEPTSDNIDWDILLRNTNKQKLIDYSKTVNCTSITTKMTKQEILDEILFTVTKRVFSDLTM